MLITLMHFDLLSIPLQVYSYVEYRPTITRVFRGNCDELSTGLSDTLEKTDEQIALNWGQLGEIIIFIYRQRSQTRGFCFLLNKFMQSYTFTIF